MKAAIVVFIFIYFNLYAVLDIYSQNSYSQNENLLNEQQLELLESNELKSILINEGNDINNKDLELYEKYLSTEITLDELDSKSEVTTNEFKTELDILENLDLNKLEFKDQKLEDEFANSFSNHILLINKIHEDENITDNEYLYKYIRGVNSFLISEWSNENSSEELLYKMNYINEDLKRMYDLRVVGKDYKIVVSITTINDEDEIKKNYDVYVAPEELKDISYCKDHALSSPADFKIMNGARIVYWAEKDGIIVSKYYPLNVYDTKKRKLKRKLIVK